MSQIVGLGSQTDMLADVPVGKLRERMVYVFRKHRPCAVFSFDPFGLYENNQDPVRVAQAVGCDTEVKLAGAFRMERFGALEPLFQLMAAPLEQSEWVPARAEVDQPREAKLDARQQAHLIPVDIHERVRLMGHHHLCAVAPSGGSARGEVLERAVARADEGQTEAGEEGLRVG